VQQATGKHYTVALSHVVHRLLHVAYSVLLHERPDALAARFAASQPSILIAAGTRSPFARLQADAVNVAA
jgi:hypothetical protein